MSLSNSISLIADKYYTIEEDTGKLIDLRSLIGSSTTILNQEILDRKADKNDVAYTLNSKLNISTYENFKNDLLPVTLNTYLKIDTFNQTNLANLRISDFLNTNSSNLRINDFNNTNSSNLRISDFNNTNSSNLQINDFLNTNSSNLRISDFNNTNSSNLRIADFLNTNSSNLRISDFNNTNSSNLRIADFNNTNLANLKIVDFDNTNLSNLKIIDFNNTNLNNLKIDDFNITINSILFTTNSKVSITDYSHFQNTVNTRLNEKVNISDYGSTHASIINQINSRVLTTDYDTYKAATAITLGEKVNILDYNANNVILGTQIASKLSSSTFNLFQVENTNNLNSKLDKTTYNTTNQSVLDQINLRQGVFTPKPPLFFQLNIEGETPIMNLVLSENEVTTLTNFHNKTDISTLFLNNSNTFNTSLSLYDTTITVNSKITTVNDSINLRVSQTTLTSTLSNYLGFNLTRSSTLVKSVDVSNYDYLKFETDKPLLILDRTNYWGYSTNTIITNNFASSRNIYCYQNLYLRNNSLIYTNDLESEFVTSTELSYLKNILSLQTQINNKAPLNNPTFTGTVAGITKTMVDLSNVDNTSDLNKPISTATQTALNSKVDSTALANNVNSNDISCNSNLYFNSAAIIYTNNSRSQYVTPFDIYCCFGSSSNLQNQITNNLSSLTTSINLRISQATLSSTLSSYDTSSAVDTKLLYTAKYDMVRGNTDDKVINLSGSSSLSFDTYNIADGIYKKDLFYDISNASSYTRNSLFSRYLRANNLWVEGTLRLNNSSVVLDNPVNSKTITATELYNLNGVSSNIQVQLNNKQSKFVYAARIFQNATISVNHGQYVLNNVNIDNTTTAGSYLFTLPTPHPNGANYFIMATASPSTGSYGVVSSTVASSTQFSIMCYNSSAVLTNTAFNFHTVP